MTPDLKQAWIKQLPYCNTMGSPFTARVLEAAWLDHERGGALAALLPGWPGDPWIDAVPLRVAGALHALALTRQSTDLAAMYESLDASDDHLRAAVASALDQHAALVADYLRVPPQTNEIGRSAVLLGGFAEVVRATGLPLATLEIGASAGLNQLWHRYRYALGNDLQWGDASSPVLIRSDWQGPAPTLPEHMPVASHAACDAQPVDLQAEGADIRLMSYVWAGQTERLARLRAAIALARAAQIRVDREDALPWLQRQLAVPRAGMATVVYHSVVWQYLSAATQAGLRSAIEAAGARATAQAPLAWLGFEPPGEAPFELSLTLWPGGQRRVLAQAQAHGQWVEWHQPAAASLT
jgi:hypothetical protein